jgi:hypothetical protein
MCKKTQSDNTIENDTVSSEISFENNNIPFESNNSDEVSNKSTEIFADFEIDLSAIELLKNSRKNLSIRESDDNKFIGYINLHYLNPDIKIGDVYIYEKYILLEEFWNDGNGWFTGGFNVYEYSPDIKINEYKMMGNKIYSCIGEPFFCKGIYNDYLFIDMGTGPGIRGVEIIDLKNNEILLSAGYEGWFYFNNNEVGGLVLSERNVKYYDDDIQTIFYNYKENAIIPENEYGDLLFTVGYNYNIITKEINITSGKYIFEQ